MINGDNVLVNLPAGKLPGKIFGNAPPYQLSGEERFEVHGAGFVTITSARSISYLCASCGHEAESDTGLCEECEDKIQHADSAWAEKDDE